MAIPNIWIRVVFPEEHWNTEPDPSPIPFNPVFALEICIDSTTGGDNEGSSISSEVSSMSLTPNLSLYECWALFAPTSMMTDARTKGSEFR